MKTRKQSHTRQKILDAAYQLFYEQGYQSTTVDQIIEKSGISKPTVYSYFSTKEDLCVAYLKERHQRETDSLIEAIEWEKTPHDRYMAVIRWLKRALMSSGYRGCGFFNMVSEIPDPGNPIIVEAKTYIDSLRDTIKSLVLDLKNSDPEKKNLDPDRIADAYYLILGGAIMGSQEYREPWPIDRAISEVEKLVQ
ncbi:MAG: TetR family transcriptional regulator [Nitrospinaceae bacterium]|nr:MAG: TetR family transcriptional regulator [Nitrospinaceae bacterium]